MSLINTASRALSEMFSRVKSENGAFGGEATVGGFYIPPKFAIEGARWGLAWQEPDEHTFLKEINVLTVSDTFGEARLGALSDPASGRTDVTQHDRKTNPLLAMPLKYQLVKMDTDVHVPYEYLNMWVQNAANKTFKISYRDFVFSRLGLDRLTVGWNGVSGSDQNTDPKADPLLSNVAKGWIQNVREQHPEQVYGDEKNHVIIDPTGATANSFKNLDQLVVALVSQIPNSFRQGLVCLVGDKLLQAERKRIYDGETLEKFKTADTFNMFGGIPRAECPCLPSDAVIVTSANNLSIYLREFSSFRQIQYNPKRQQAEDYQSHYIAFVVENARKFVAFTHIKQAGESLGETSIFNKIANNAALVSEAEKQKNQSLFI